MPRRRGPLAENRNAPPERVLVAQRLLGQMRYASARQALMEQFKIARTTATRALQMARMLMARDEEEGRPFARAVIVSRLSALADKAEAAGDFSSAIRAFRELVKVHGLAAPIDVNINPKPKATAYEDLTDEELAALAALDRAPTGESEH